MKHSQRIRYVIIMVVIGLCFWMLASKQLNLGLDLQGGVDLVYEIDRAKLVELTLNNNRQEVKKILEQNEILGGFVDVSANNTGIEVTIPESDAAKFQDIESRIREIRNLKLNNERTSSDNGKIVLDFDDAELKKLENDSIDKILEILRNRIDEFKVSEPIISRQGESQIRVQLPGVQRSKDAMKVLTSQAQLSFRLVAERDGQPMIADSISKITQFGKINEDEEVVYGIFDEKDKRQPVYVLKKDILLTGDLLSDSYMGIDELQKPVVYLNFNGIGGEKFWDVTSANVNKFLAIVMDGKVQSAPRVNEGIPSGRAVIQGSFTDPEAKRLAIVLRCGALPTPIKKDSELSVGPSLGRDSIHKGVVAICVGLLAVVLYMIFYYKFMGLVADMALLMNLVILLGVMQLLNATLTLPGIAGILLTIGMSVDANVIVYERIKEEMRLGKTIYSAVDSGFDRAFTAIFDANITTLITAIVLYIFGTGPIQGFAVTVGIGVVASMFTALFVVRTIVNSVVSQKHVKTLSI